MSVANATTIHLGNVDDETRYFGDFHLEERTHFKDLARFRITEQSAVNFSFTSFYDILAEHLQSEPTGARTAIKWDNVAFGSPSFVDLSSGAYRWVVTGATGRQGGFWDAKMSVAAVPEADVWMMLSDWCRIGRLSAASQTASSIKHHTVRRLGDERIRLEGGGVRNAFAV